MDAISDSEKYPHSSSSPITYPNRSQSPSSSSEPSVTNQVQPASGVKNFAYALGDPDDSCEYRGGKAFLSSAGSKSRNHSSLQRAKPA
jgi:hypothetical protein